ncbi:MAG: DUF3598 domain-containing protein [Sphingomonadales bacterium]
MSHGIDLRAEMPLLARHEGQWTGMYRYVTPDFQLVDAHRADLTCRMPTEGDYPYWQTNANIWLDDNGAEAKRQDMEFPATYRDKKIWFDGDIITGWCGELTQDETNASIMVSWRWNDLSLIPMPITDLHMYEMIQLSGCGNHRSRVWHWIDDGKLILRTLIEETRVSGAA